MTAPRRFYLDRTTDITGASGTGRVADGVLWPDGTASLRWLGERPSTVHWDRIEDAEAVHGHGGYTRIVWLDWENEPYNPDAPCPHCPDGHGSPNRTAWAAWVAPDRDGDGQPTTIHVAPTGGAHVAEPDAQWVRDRLNGTTEPTTDPRALGGNIVGPGGPRDRHGVIIDDTRAVLLEEIETALVETGGQDIVLALMLRGRINKAKATDRANALFLMDGNGAAALVADLVALARRISPDFAQALVQQSARLAAEGADGS